MVKFLRVYIQIQPLSGEEEIWKGVVALGPLASWGGVCYEGPAFACGCEFKPLSCHAYCLFSCMNLLQRFKLIDANLPVLPNDPNVRNFSHVP